LATWPAVAVSQIGASLGPQLTGALAGQGFGGILRIVAVALVLGIALAQPACATSPPSDHPAIRHSS
jgi:hypothetical protein